MRRTTSDYEWAIKRLNSRLADLCSDPEKKATCGTEWGFVPYRAYGYTGLHFQDYKSPGVSDVFTGDTMTIAVEKILAMAETLRLGAIANEH